jgi:hypothetical protein
VPAKFRNARITPNHKPSSPHSPPASRAGSSRRSVEHVTRIRRIQMGGMHTDCGRRARAHTRLPAVPTAPRGRTTTRGPG